MPGILASAVVLASLLVGQPPVRPIPTDCCAESTVLPGSLSVYFKGGVSPERAEEITTEVGVMVRWITSGTWTVVANICAPTGQEAALAAIFETYYAVSRTWVWGPGCDAGEPRCGCCPSGYFCADLPPCDPRYKIPDGDADGFPDRCDICTDSDGDLFGDPDFYNPKCPEDNCPDAFNADQADYDADGLGDVCDRQLTICHDPPGPRIGTQTIDINEGAFSIHQSHGDTLGPCDIENPCNVPFTRVLHTWSGLYAERFEVIADEDAWCDLWSELYGGYYYPLPCDTTLVDFETEVAVVAGIGARGNGCFNVNVTCIRKPAGVGNIWVEVIERQPGPYCICTAAVVNPLEIVKMPRFGTRRISFKKRIEILDCE